jgi:serine/threonine protein kinase
MIFHNSRRNQQTVIPEKISRYVIKEKLGQGGMATVYRALDPRFKRDVAIKVLPPAYLSNETFKARFEREAQVIASLEYPGIVPVYDFGEENDQPYLVMRFMPGGSLADRISEGPLKLEEIVRIFTRLAPALDHFHAQGIVHRDLKPGNILFDQYDTAYISDFGIARLSEGTTSLTGEALIGTPAYMSPEQAQGLRDIDGRSDIYALGAILYEALTGKQPYEATTPMGVILKHITEPAPRLLKIKSDLPEELEWVIERSMEKDRARRYPTASAMVAEMAVLLENRADVHGASIQPQPVETPGKRITWHSPSNNIPHKKSQSLTDAPDQIDSSTVLEKEPDSSQQNKDALKKAPDSAKSVPIKKIEKPPVVPPFIMSEADQELHERAATDKLKAGRSVSIPVDQPKNKLKMIWIISSILVVGVVCAMVLFGGWFFSAFFAKPTDNILDSLETPAQTNGTIIEDQPILSDTIDTGTLFDDFSNPDSGWWVYQGNEGLMGYQAGSFQIKVDIPDWYLINSPGYITNDATIEVEAYKSSGPDNNLFGIICRYQDSQNFYFFVIGSSGYYGIGKVLGGEPLLITNEGNTYSSAINQGRTSNLLRADCIENTLTLYANNTRLVEVEDFEYTTGAVGLFVGTFDIYGVNILFDNFKVTVFSRP